MGRARTLESGVFSVIRGLVLARKLHEAHAAGAVGRIPRLGVEHVSLDGLLARMWRMRSDIAACDAPYVALAQSRGLTLVTSDGRLARGATAYCRVEFVR
jgi:predicted nucleic acid-binding protein